MRIAVMKKIRSRKGASITFALLAFLVCSVVSAVVLAAASASAGRVSGLADMDRRYYAVSSAAQLFSETLNGQEFTIERSKIETGYTYKTYAKSLTGTVTELDAANIPTELVAPGGSVQKLFMSVKLPDEDLSDPSDPIKFFDPNDFGVDSDYAVSDEYVTADQEDENHVTQSLIADAAAKSILADAALQCVIGGPKTVVDAFQPYDPDEFGKSSPAAGIEKEMQVEIKAASAEDKTDYGPLKVDVAYKLLPDGSLSIVLSNHVEGTETDVFSIEVIMAASVRDNTKSPTVTVTEEVAVAPTTTEGQYIKRTKTVTTTKKTTVITWTVTDVRKVSA